MRGLIFRATVRLRHRLGLVGLAGAGCAVPVGHEREDAQVGAGGVGLADAGGAHQDPAAVAASAGPVEADAVPGVGAFGDAVPVLISGQGLVLGADPAVEQAHETVHVEVVVERPAAAGRGLGGGHAHLLQGLGVGPERAEHQRCHEGAHRTHRAVLPVEDQLGRGLAGREDGVHARQGLCGDAAGAEAVDVDAQAVLQQQPLHLGVLEVVGLGGHLGLDRDDPVERPQRVARDQQGDQPGQGERKGEKDVDR